MKNIINSFMAAAAIAAGYMAGCYLWSEVIEDKVDDFRCYLNNKKNK